MLKRTIYLSNPARLSVKDGQMIYKPAEGEIKTVPIEDLGFVVIENMQITATIPLLNALNENNVAVIFCNEKHLPASMLLNLDGHSIQTELFTQQINASLPLKKNLWKQTIEAKIRNQASLLQKLGKEEKGLIAISRSIKSGDPDNREGMAARIYWNQLFGRDFTRDRFGESPNMLLNYGYTILRAAIARGLTGSGLLPTLGIFHHNRYNSYCLADDIMEPFRPFVDLYVFEIHSRNPDLYILETEDKLKLLEVLSSDVVLNKLLRPLLVAVSYTTASLARCFSGETNKILYPEFAST
jgi:CRISPR-associated protein Cas1